MLLGTHTMLDTSASRLLNYKNTEVFVLTCFPLAQTGDFFWRALAVDLHVFTAPSTGDHAHALQARRKRELPHDTHLKRLLNIQQ